MAPLVEDVITGLEFLVDLPMSSLVDQKDERKKELRNVIDTFQITVLVGENYYGFLKKVRTHRKRKATCKKKKRTCTKKKRTHRKKKAPATKIALQAILDY